MSSDYYVKRAWKWWGDFNQERLKKAWEILDGNLHIFYIKSEYIAKKLQFCTIKYLQNDKNAFQIKEKKRRKCDEGIQKKIKMSVAF